MLALISRATAAVAAQFIRSRSFAGGSLGRLDKIGDHDAVHRRTRKLGAANVVVVEETARSVANGEQTIDINSLSK